MSRIRNSVCCKARRQIGEFICRVLTMFILRASGDNAIVVNHDKFTVINYAFRSISFPYRESTLSVSLSLAEYSSSFSFPSLCPSVPWPSLSSPVFPLLSTNNRRTPRVLSSNDQTLAFHLGFIPS